MWLSCWWPRNASNHSQQQVEAKEMLPERDKGQQADASPKALRDLGVTALCLSAEHAAVFLGLPAEHARRIKQLGQAGKLQRVAVGKSFVFPVAGLQEYVAANTSAK